MTDVRCPVCARPSPGGAAVQLEAIPILINVLLRDQEAARAAPSAPLALHGCDGCGLLWNAAFTGVPYGPGYHVDQARSPRFAAHADEVAAHVAGLLPAEGATVVEVGAGQGGFLARLADRLGPRLAQAHGFDPAFRGDGPPLPPNVRVHAATLDAPSPAGEALAPHAVVTRHLLEHLPDPVGFLAGLKRRFAAHPFTLVIETPDAAWTLGRGLLHDFIYEHCVLHAASSLREALRRAGYGAIRLAPAFGGEYVLTTARSAPAPDEVAAPPAAAAHVGTHDCLARIGARFVTAHRARLRADRARGPIAVWGGAGKGALFARLVDPDGELLDFVIDIDPAKAGTFLPGSGLPVVGPEEGRARGVATVVIANGNYAAEIAARCRAAGLTAARWCVGAPDAPAEEAA